MSHFQIVKNMGEDVCILIQCIVHYEQELEYLRKNIAENEKYDPLLVFSDIIKDQQNGFIDRIALKRFFAQHRQALTDRGTDFFLNYFCKNPQAGLSIDDFFGIILPKTDQKLTERVQERGFKQLNQQVQTNNQKSAYYINQQVVKILLLEYQFLNELESKKITFVGKYNWDLLAVYKMFDPLNTGQITYQQFKTVMNNNNYIFDKNMYKAFLRRTNKDDNDIITKDEFFDSSFIVPLMDQQSRHSNRQSLYQSVSQQQNFEDNSRSMQNEEINQQDQADEMIEQDYIPRNEHPQMSPYNNKQQYQQQPLKPYQQQQNKPINFINYNPNKYSMGGQQSIKNGQPLQASRNQKINNNQQYEQQMNIQQQQQQQQLQNQHSQFQQNTGSFPPLVMDLETLQEQRPSQKLSFHSKSTPNNRSSMIRQQN